MPKAEKTSEDIPRDRTSESPQCDICETRPLRELEGTPATEQLHQSFFHSTCDQCNTENTLFEKEQRLCQFCTHLRIRHFLRCHPADGRAILVPTANLLEKGCIFCEFVRAHIVETGPTAGAIAIHETDCIELKKCEHIDNDPETGDFFTNWPVLLDVDSPVWNHDRLDISITKEAPENGRKGTSYHGLYVAYKVFDGDEFPSSTSQALAPLIDWTSLRKFPFGMQFKNTDGSHTYRTKKDPARPYGWWDPDLLPRNFKCIDVERECLVSVPRSSPYITLSYVWGLPTDNELQTRMDNVAILSTPGAFSKHHLPNTIRDAIIVCKNLRHRYLWIDRLCLVQDSPDLPLHLQAMGSIYHAATLTLVAASSTSASSGLPGVRRARTWRQNALNLHGIHFHPCVPRLDEHLESSKWATRGWTFQEEVMSSCLLYFTPFGMFYACNVPGPTISEAPASPISDCWPAVSKHQAPLRADYRTAVFWYSRRELSFAADYLAAFSGILFALFGAGTVVGIPRGNFDREVLWETSRLDKCGPGGSLFPSWSWLSRYDIEMPHEQEVISVAVWFSAVKFDTGEVGFRALEPTLQEDHFGYRPGGMVQAAWDAQQRVARLTAALALHEGIVKGAVPKAMTGRYSAEALAASLATQWPHYIDYWHETLGTTARQQDAILQDHHKQAGMLDDRIVVHTQLASFSLDHIAAQTPREETKHGVAVVIRDTHHFPVGTIFLSNSWLKEHANPHTQHFEFIALSTTCDHLWADRYRWFCDYPPDAKHPAGLNRFVGCPCARDTTFSALLHNHTTLCPSHRDYLPTPRSTTSFDHFMRRFAGVLEYKDGEDNELLENTFFAPSAAEGEEGVFTYLNVAAVRVMLIERQSREPWIATRVGIGQVFMKKWVEVGPRFETLVLA